MALAALDAELASARFSGLSNQGISYGATGHYAFGRALLGADVAHTTYGNEWLDNGRSDDLNSTQVAGTASYAIFRHRNWTVFPTLRVGLGQFDVTLRDR